MPNGTERYYVNLEMVIGLFRLHYGRWPMRARLHPNILRIIKEVVLTEAGLEKLSQRIEVVEDDTIGIVVEDETGDQQVDIRNLHEFPSAARLWEYSDQIDEWFGMDWETDYRPDTFSS